MFAHCGSCYRTREEFDRALAQLIGRDVGVSTGVDNTDIVVNSIAAARLAIAVLSLGGFDIYEWNEDGTSAWWGYVCYKRDAPEHVALTLAPEDPAELEALEWGLCSVVQQSTVAGRKVIGERLWPGERFEREDEAIRAARRASHNERVVVAKLIPGEAESA